MADSTHGLKQRLIGLGTEKLQELMGELMKNDHFQQALGNGMTRALSAKNQLDKNMQTMLALFSVPSRADVRRLEDRIEALAGQLAALNARLDAQGGARSGGARRGAAPKRKPAR